MEETKVKLDTIDKVKDFVQKIAKFPEDIELATDHYIVDAKSILGVLSLDLNKPLNLRIHGGGKRIALILDELEEFRGD